jgi:hypothetical protein
MNVKAPRDLKQNMTTLNQDCQLLTFCIPSFGDARYLINTLISIERQTIPCYVSICFGGEPPAAIKTFCDAHHWIKFTTVNPDPGMVECWTHAARHANTKYIAFISDDNSVEYNYAELMVNFLTSHEKLDFVFCNQSYLSDKGDVDPVKSSEVNHVFGRDKLPEGPIPNNLIPFLIKTNSVPLEASVFRRTLWTAHEPFNPQCYGAFDFEFLIRILLSGAKPGFIKEYLFNFRWHDNAYCIRQREEHLNGSIFAFKKLENHSLEDWKSYFKTKYSRLECRTLRYNIPLNSRFETSFRLIRDGYLFDVLKQSIAYFRPVA